MTFRPKSTLNSTGSGSSNLDQRSFGGGNAGSNREVVSEERRLASATAPRAVERESAARGQASGAPKTSGQLRAICATARNKGLDDEGLRDVIEDVTRRTRSKSALTYSEANRVIARLKGNAYVSLRTLQYRRQRAGVKQIITREQEERIAALASQRNWSAETLVNFCKRQCGHHPLRTTIDANKVIEALKAMNKRDRLWAA